MKIPVKTREGGYEITLERGAVSRFSLGRRALVVTDGGVPRQYAQAVADGCKSAEILTVKQGEASKCEKTLFEILRALTERGFARGDCVVAAGGGVVGDLAGFAAAVYMRGIDFYNVPTTLLSQVDSSIGGKTAIDFMGYKNIVGAFHQPRAVTIDPDVLDTLPARQLANGMAESIKMALTCDKELFELIEGGADIDTVIYRSLLIKKRIVEEDEREAGLRRVLNFGHTLAHAIEKESGLYHGECVALGMLPMCAPGVRERLTPLYERWGLPTVYRGGGLYEAVTHDKKGTADGIVTVFVPEVGKYEFITRSADEIIPEEWK